MGWKIARDKNEAWCRANGVSGQWRTSPDPLSALLRKIFEEAGEYAEHRDPAELYDLADVLVQLLKLADPDGVARRAHAAKLAQMGDFGRLVEWCPVPVAEPLTHYAPSVKGLVGDIQPWIACGTLRWALVSDDPLKVTCEECREAACTEFHTPAGEAGSDAPPA